jgi:hypothetical protein
VSNFSFISGDWKILARLGKLAEMTAAKKSAHSIKYSGQFTDTLIRAMYAYEGVRESNRLQAKPIQTLRWRGALPDSLQGVFDAVLGICTFYDTNNKADETVASICVRFCYRLAV